MEYAAHSPLNISEYAYWNESAKSLVTFSQDAKWFQFNLVALAGRGVFRRTSWIYLRFSFDQKFHVGLLKVSSHEWINILGNFKEIVQPFKVHVNLPKCLTKNFPSIFVSSRDFTSFRLNGARL